MTAFRATTQTGDAAKEESYLHVYCDNSAHFKPREDELNKQRPDDKKIREDPDTKVFFEGQACPFPGTRMVTPRTQGLKLEDGTEYPPRAILDVRTPLSSALSWC